ncbi:MAG TPA: hypothetical protein VFJ16_19710 [Longimicrobium sp.]|nr:hypothetical protein [Longimicrobium sp.]
MPARAHRPSGGGLELVRATAGVPKARGACVPLEPPQPGGWTRLMLDDAGVAGWLTLERLRARVPAPPRDSTVRTRTRH